MSTTEYEGLEDESISDNKLEMNMFVGVNSSSQKIDLSLYNLTLATVPPGFRLSAKSGKKVPWIRDFSLILFETKPGRPDVKSGIFPTLVDSHGHNQQHSLQIRQHCCYGQETAESAENHSRVFFQFFKSRLNL